MATFSTKVDRILQAGLVAGFLVCLSIVVLGWIIDTGASVNRFGVWELKPIAQLVAKSTLFLFLFVVLGAFGGMVLGLTSAFACLPAMSAVAIIGERLGLESPAYYVVGGMISALATGGIVFVAVMATLDEAALSDGPKSSNIVVLLAMGGAIAGYWYWRLARRDILAAQASP